MSLTEDRIVVVTGASRGAGKGIALALGATGATVYVTGRTRAEGDAASPARSSPRPRRSAPAAAPACP
ncbi:SDR family NAD(P)-dependent oxidoreductase [Actinomadura luteofluorescens]|uniref:SDR family NAD(P)-dependent oxidoreductase n=1 Tax=Actinomadura luteofluorescens TaxID=46163 RepID=UPI003630BA9C